MFTLNGMKFTVRYGEEIKKARKNIKVRTTEVIVTDANTKKEEPIVVLAIGKAICSKKDNFQKEVGRKIALGRAIANLKLSKLETSNIWNAYFSRSEKNG